MKLALSFFLFCSACLAGVNPQRVTAVAPLTLTGVGAMGCRIASGAQSGCLSSADWSSFNSKQAALPAGTNGQFLKLVGGSPLWADVSSSVAWGAITGTLSNQTDLASALALKAPLLSPTFSGTTTFSALTLSTVPYLDASKVLTSSSVSPTELGYLSGVTSALQPQIDAKSPLASPTFTGTVTTPNIIVSGLTATTVPYLNGSKALTSSAVTPTELGYVSGVTSGLQTQIDAKAPSASPTFSGTTTFSALTATTVPYLNASKVLTSSAVTPTELGYVSGVTSAIQTQFAAKAPSASPTFTGTTTFSSLSATTVPYLDVSKALTSSAVTPTELGYVSGVTSALQTQLNAKLPSTGVGLVEVFTGFIESGSDKIYVLDQSAAYAYTINTLIAATVSGTTTVAVKINGTNVTGISALSVSSTPATGTASAANSVSIGDKVTLVLSSSSSPVDLSFTLKYTR